MTTDHAFKSGWGADVPYSALTARDAVLVNKQYHDEIEQEMAALAEPKIRDAIETQRRKGNGAYFRHDWRGDGSPLYLYEEGIQETFDPVPPEHELTHLVARVAHTPQQEMFGLAVELGITYGVNLARWPRLADPKWAEVRQRRISEYRKRATLYYQSLPPDVGSPRNWAVYYAIGMYIREKMEQFAAADMLDESYAAQKHFCENYQYNDQSPVAVERLIFDAEHLLDAPYDLVKLSREEWRAITAVATGLAEPKDTPYPQRLTAIKDALVHVGLFHDMKPVFEKAAENHEANICDYNAKVEEKNRTTHEATPEKFATVRGVDMEMHHAARARRGTPASGTRAL